MDPEELALWQALYAVEGFGERAHDLRAGVIAATVANYAGRISEAVVKPSEVIPDAWSVDDTPEVDVDDKLNQRFTMLAASQKRQSE